MITYQGKWQITVTGKDSSFNQRLIISGASFGSGTIPGVIGATQIINGNSWNLTIEHNDGTHGWQDNASIEQDSLQEIGANISQVVRSKDVFHPGDTVPNDLVILVNKLGPMFDITLRPYAVDEETLLMFSDGIFVGINGLQFMGVEIKNTWGEAFGDELLFDISDTGRATLASFGIIVIDSWTPQALAATQQTIQGRTIRIPQLKINEKTTVYFLVDASGARKGKPVVEFMLHNTIGESDPGNSMRYNARSIFIADISYDKNTGTSVIEVPEGKVTLTLKSLAIDVSVLKNLCKGSMRQSKGSGAQTKLIAEDINRLLKSAPGGHCDQKLLSKLIALLEECLDRSDCGCGAGPVNPKGNGWKRVCAPGGIWLPLKFEYTVEIKDGFSGQYGPLAFQDPWWKVLLLIIALIAWLVALIESIVADKTGWGNVGDHPRKIGIVGTSNRASTDAAIIELDGSRPFVQQVLDAISGEPNTSFIVGMNTLISIDPQVAFPSLASADVVGKHVFKSGSRTGLTHGIISSIGPFTQSRGNGHPDLNFTRSQFTIGTDPAFATDQSTIDGLFDDHGDSGSIVLSNEPATQNQVVGLLHSGSGGTSPIQDVLDALMLKLR